MVRGVAVCLVLSASPALAQDPALSCQPHAVFQQIMADQGAYLAMAELLRDDPGRRLEAFYQPQSCIWTLLIVDLTDGQVAEASNTCLLGEGDPGVCIPPPR